MKTTREKILEYIKKRGNISPMEIYNEFGINRSITHRHLKKLIENELIEKSGSAPRVFYSVKKIKINKNYDFLLEEKKVLEENFYFIDSVGKEFFGEKGFIFWCQKRKFDVKKKSEEYFKIFKKYQNIRKNNLLEATSKIKKTFGKKCCVEKLFYFDFYSIEIFGKTKMGQKVLYAKNSGNRKKILEISKEIKDSLEFLIKKEKIDSVVFVPPTVSRNIQFMKIIESNLKLKIPKIKVIKNFSDVRVPQKTLKKLEDRIENANGTFMISDNSIFKKTLIIDDAVGSGASINQIACKLKKNGNTKKVIGFAIVGSLNDFEVISEI